MNEAFDEIANLREAVARLEQAVDELRRSGEG
jgi:ubiquinone biosynthesis protein UbiJ